MFETIDKYETILLERDGRVARLMLNRPDRLNAINLRMLDEIQHALGRVADDESLSVTILRGAGRAFSAGFDVQRQDGSEGLEYAPMDPLAERAELRGRILALLSVWDHPKPVIAAVHGYCFAAATMLAALSDITVVADDTAVGLPQLPLGGGFLSPAWVHLVGPKRAKQMSYIAGERISGATAADWGWANYSVPADALEEDVAEMARRISRTPVDVLMLKKAAVNRIVDADGFRSLLLVGAEADALAHLSGGVRKIYEHIQEYGLKAAIAAFNDGEIEL